MTLAVCWGSFLGGVGATLLALALFAVGAALYWWLTKGTV